MPRVRFTETRVVKDPTGTTFIAGQEYDLPRASVDRWVRRGAAVEIEEAPPPPPPPAEDPPPAARLQHAGAGYWHVLTADGTKLTERPLPKAEAEELLATHLAAQQEPPAA